MDFGAFGLVAVEDALAVEVEQLGISANEPDRVSRSRQILRTALFKRGQIDGLYAQRFADGVEIEAELLAALAQQRSDGEHLIVRLGRALFSRVVERCFYPLEQAHGTISLLNHPMASGRGCRIGA